MTHRERYMDILFRLFGQPYRWGGDDSIEGFDCSGLVIEGLKGVGVLPRTGDWTANALRGLFHEIDESDIRPGCLVFWIQGNRAVHVETIIDPTELAIGASGGGSSTTSPDAAAKANAFVKVRPWASRPGPRVFADPFAGED